jgi:hypothetical protein
MVKGCIFYGFVAIKILAPAVGAVWTQDVAGEHCYQVLKEQQKRHLNLIWIDESSKYLARFFVFRKGMVSGIPITTGHMFLKCGWKSTFNDKLLDM